VRVAVVVLAILGVSATAIAGPHKVLVLPLDGTADPAMKAKLSASVQRLARVVDGQVTPGDTTFAETAAAVGCDPGVPSCIDSVCSTLGVDEIVYGTVVVQGQQGKLVVRRAERGKPPREVTASFPTKQPEKAEQQVLPLFSGTAPVGEDNPLELKDKPPTDPKLRTDPKEHPGDPDHATNGANTMQTPPTSGTPLVDTPTSDDRRYGIAAAAGGGVMLLIGIALWSTASSLQQDIDNHPTQTFDQLSDLRALEDKTRNRALFGDIMVIGGLALGGYGGYLLWRDHNARATVAPAPADHGAAVTITLRGWP
jgi:hypothetical protein